MELGYIGIAYNRPIKGVMSDHHRRSISLLLLLCQSPPRPPQCSTRLIVCVENHSQALALNSGNPILKTYDLVAVKPLDQNALDDACDKSEIDIIAIDFSERLPFRLKQTKGGVYFEIMYSDLMADVQTRWQMISNAKDHEISVERSISLERNFEDENELRMVKFEFATFSRGRFPSPDALTVGGSYNL